MQALLAPYHGLASRLSSRVTLLQTVASHASLRRRYCNHHFPAARTQPMRDSNRGHAVTGAPKQSATHNGPIVLLFSM
jgi:hypothetical protein